MQGSFRFGASKTELWIEGSTLWDVVTRVISKEKDS